MIFKAGINEEQLLRAFWHCFALGHGYQCIVLMPSPVMQEAGKAAMAAAQFRLLLQSTNVASFRSGQLQSHTAKAEQRF